MTIAMKVVSTSPTEPSDHPDAPLPTVETREDSGMDRPPEGKEPAPSEQVQVDVMALRQKVSNLELENKLLKREVASLNDELSSVMVRMREAGGSVNQYEGEMATLREQVLRADHMIRQLRSHEEDLQASLVAKDSQVQVRSNYTVLGIFFPSYVLVEASLLIYTYHLV